MNDVRVNKCECYDDEGVFDRYNGCTVHVSCDSNCQALLEPVTLEETQKALTHYKTHGYLSGCSHGH